MQNLKLHGKQSWKNESGHLFIKKKNDTNKHHLLLVTQGQRNIIELIWRLHSLIVNDKEYILK